MNELRNQILSLLKTGRLCEIIFQEMLTPEKTRALKKMGRVIGDFLQD